MLKLPTHLDGSLRSLNNAIFICFCSGSWLGGVVATLSFYFNHEECTRVMWTPPLRESFGYPLSLLQILLLSWTLKGQNEGRYKKSVILSIVTCLYLLSWQFAQFTLFTQTSVIFGLYTLELFPEKANVNVKAVLYGLLVSQQ